MLLRISALHFVAGVVPGGPAAPILRYMATWELVRIQDYCRRKGWDLEVVNPNPRREHTVPRISARSGGQDTADYAPIIKWREVKPGTEIEAFYKGMRQGKFGPLADLENDGQKLTVPVPTALMTQLSRVRTGAKVAITYNGKREGKAGRTYHDFQVDVFQEEDLLPEGTAANVAPAQGYDRPIGGGQDTRPIGLAAVASTVAPGDETAKVAAPKKGRTLKGVFAGLDK